MSVNTEAPAKQAPVKKASKLRDLLRNAALSCGTLFFCLLLTELGLRVAGYGNLEIYVPDSAVYWRLKPNQDCYTKVGRKPVHINSHGTRGLDFMIPKPTNVVRILSLGDSVTFGWGLSEEETYSRLLQHRLQSQVKDGTQIEVINAGVNAWSYPQVFVFLRDYGLKFQPDYVILGGGNLWTQFSENADPEFVAKFKSRVRLKNLLRRFAIYHYVVEVQLQDFYSKHRSKFIPVDPKKDQMFKDQQKDDPEGYFRDAIEKFCKVARENNVTPIILHTPVLTDLESNFESSVHRAKKQVAERLNVPLVDPTAQIQPQAVNLYLEADPVHFNFEGNKILAQQLSESFKSILSK